MRKTAKLGDIVNIEIGKTPPRNNPKYWDKDKVSGNVWLSIADLTASESRYVSDSKEYVSDEGAALFKSIPKSTLIMSYKLSIGKLAFTDRELRTNEAIAALKIIDENTLKKEYLYYALAAINWERMAGDDVKVKGKTLNKAKLKEVELPLPPLKEQQHIVTKLDSAIAEIDSAIEATHKKFDEIEKLKSSILVQQLDSKNRSNEWKTIKLGDVCDIKSGNSIPVKEKKQKYTNIKEGTPYVATKDIGFDGSINYENGVRIPSEASEKFRLSKENSTLICAEGGSAGRKIAYSTISCHYVNKLFSVSPRTKMTPKFIYYYALGDEFQNHFKNALHGLIGGVSLSKIKNFPITFPPLEEQERIVAKLDSTFTEIEIISDVTQKKTLELTALKSAFLTQELSGKVA